MVVISAFCTEDSYTPFAKVVVRVTFTIFGDPSVFRRIERPPSRDAQGRRGREPHVEYERQIGQFPGDASRGLPGQLFAVQLLDVLADYRAGVRVHFRGRHPGFEKPSYRANRAVVEPKQFLRRLRHLRRAGLGAGRHHAVRQNNHAVRIRKNEIDGAVVRGPNGPVFRVRGEGGRGHEQETRND
jgi:hypothetical protein